MFKKLALVTMGLMMTVSSVGCCCFGWGGYGSGYGMNRCAPCNNGCAPAGTYYPPQGAFYQGAVTSQTAFVDPTQTAYAPISTGYTSTTASAFVPTSTAALMPGAIQGPPIYNTAVVPANNLPMY